MDAPRPLPTEDQRNVIRGGVRAIVSRFGDDYWLARDEDGAFPREFHRAMAGRRLARRHHARVLRRRRASGAYVHMTSTS